MKRLSFVLMMLLSISLFGQDKLTLFPDDLTVQPFTANQLEPKLGFLFQTEKAELRLDVGNSIDVLRYKLNEKETVSFGADMFTYSMLERESDFHFPVVAIDYLFGVNFGYKREVSNTTEMGARFRISHISAHFVDGHFSKHENKWKDNIEPQVYSREFFELMPYYKYKNLRAYAGITYIYHVDPGHLGTDSYQVGFDYFHPICGKEVLSLFTGYDLKVTNMTDYEYNHSFTLGVKLGKYFGKGVSVYYNYFSGKSIHGEYYFVDKEYSAIGINFDL